MKHFFIILLTSAAIISINAQQGAVSFINSAATPILFYGYGTNANARVALYGSTQTNSSAGSLLTQVGATADTFAPGIFSGGTRNIGLPGDLVTLQVRAWTGGFATYEQALAAAMTDPNIGLGCSTCWVQPVGGGALPTAPITGVGRFQGLNPWATPLCTIVPEPSILSLGLVGMAFAIFFCRRRK